MAYFANGTEGEMYQDRYCSRCIHDANQDCPILLLHLAYNYEECNKPDSFLHVLIPRSKDGLGNEQCKMFVGAKHEEERVPLVDLIAADAVNRS